MTVERALAVLGLTGQPSPDEIRRAYLRQVKQHPPERDRDGFQRVREAFDFLKRNPWLVYQAAETETETETETESALADPPAMQLASSEPAGEAESFERGELERQLEELNEARANDDPVAGARAMTKLYARQPPEAGPIPSPLLCLQTFIALVERKDFEDARQLLEAFEGHAALHRMEASFGADISARWRLAREVAAISDYDRPLASAMARGLRTGRMSAAAEQLDRALESRGKVERLKAGAPTIWGMLEPLRQEVARQAEPRFRDIGAWPIGVLAVVLIHLMRLCVPSTTPSVSSSSYSDRPTPGVLRAAADEPAPAPEPAPSFGPLLSFRQRAELQAEQAWKSLQSSLQRGDCEGVRDQWPLYRVAAVDEVVDATTAANRRKEVLEMCFELEPLLDDKP
jgi:hypothetical protein